MPSDKRVQAIEKEEKIQDALEALNNDKNLNVAATAREYNVSYDTLRRRVSGGQSRTQGKENQRLLSDAEEQELARWIKLLTATGHPARYAFVREMAEEIRKRRVVNINEENITYVSYEPIGKKWVQRFINRHPNLKAAITDSIEYGRMKDVTREAVQNWFKVYREVVDEKGIRLENIYNVDETGCTLSILR